MCFKYEKKTKNGKKSTTESFYFGMPPIENIELNGNKNSIEKRISKESQANQKYKSYDVDEIESQSKRKIKIAIAIILVFIILLTAVAILARILNLLQ